MQESSLSIAGDVYRSVSQDRTRFHAYPDKFEVHFAVCLETRMLDHGGRIKLIVAHFSSAKGIFSLLQVYKKKRSKCYGTTSQKHCNPFFTTGYQQRGKSWPQRSRCSYIEGGGLCQQGGGTSVEAMSVGGGRTSVCVCGGVTLIQT